MQYSGQHYPAVPGCKRIQYFEESFAAPQQIPSDRNYLPHGYNNGSGQIIQQLSQQVELLTERLNKLSQYLQIDETGDPTVIITGANLQIVNSRNILEPERNTRGLGNLFLGHNLLHKRATHADRTGSHNLIIGDHHRYTGSNSIIVGRKNILQKSSCIIGGFKNLACAEYATVLSGCYNKAFGWNSSIIGGWSKQTKQQQQQMICVEKTPV